MAVDFDNLPFDEAIDQSADRLDLDRPTFDALTREAKARAFTLAFVSAVDAIVAVHSAHQAALAEGLTLHEFRERLPQMLETRGWHGERPWHADLVFRQQGMMSYAAGRFAQMRDAGIAHWKYSALMDGRTRPTHAALDGKVFAMDDRRYYPPWDFGCRCIAEPVFDDELPDEEVVRSDGLVGRRVGSDPVTGEEIHMPPTGRRFEWDPEAFGTASSRLAGVELDRVPTELRAAVEALLNRVQRETR